MKFDKEYMKIDGEYLIYKNIEKLREVFDEIIVISNHSEHYKNQNVKVCRDVFYRKGPLAGLHSGLVYTDYKFSFLIACDMPNINVNFIRFLISNIDENYDGLICLDENGEVMPMYGIYKNELKFKIRDLLMNDLKKFKAFILENNFKFLKFEAYREQINCNIFENLNTFEELNCFNERLTK